MKCPECQGPVRFNKCDIVCSRCEWHPPTSVIDSYSMVGFTDRRILLGSAFLSLLGLGYYLILGQPIALAIVIVALVTVPVLVTLRDRWMAKILTESQ